MTTALQARSADELDAIARTFAASLTPGDVVTLRGPLGSGKTAFVRGIVAALHGDDERVGSPTFVYWHRYEGAPPINHLDLYRVEGGGELAALGLDDALDPSAIVLVEWPERGAGWLPGGAIAVTISGCGTQTRDIEISRPDR